MNERLTDEEIDALAASLPQPPWGIGSRRPDAREFARAIESAVIARAAVPVVQPIPEGWKLVPVEPTEEMWTAGRDPIMYRDVKFHVPESMEAPPWRINPATGKVERDQSKGTTAVHVWRAMLAAAPQAPAAQPIPESAILARMKYHFRPADEDRDEDDFDLYDADIECAECIPVLIVRADAVAASPEAVQPMPEGGKEGGNE